MITAGRSTAWPRVAPVKESSNDAIVVATPAFPISARVMMIQRRPGSLTTSSDSAVVKPTP